MERGSLGVGEGSLVNDVAFGIERQLPFESADTAHPVHRPDSSQLGAMRRRSRSDDQLLEAVFATATAGMTSGDPFGASMIDGNGQRLSSLRLFRIERTGTQNSTGLRRTSRSRCLQNFSQPTDRSHDSSGLDRKKDCRSLPLRERR